MHRAVAAIHMSERLKIGTEIGELCRAISSQSRRQILLLLRKGAMTVNEIASEVRISRPAVSQHLRILLAARLVDFEREGSYSFYRLELRELEHLRDFIVMLCGSTAGGHLRGRFSFDRTAMPSR
jgi:DNA-binding transcriptional ArsR family regulator